MQSLLVNCKNKLTKNMEWNRNSTEEIDLDKVQNTQNLLVVLQKKINRFKPTRSLLDPSQHKTENI